MTTLIKEPEPVRVHRWEARRSRRNVGGPERGTRLGVGAAAAIGAVFAPPLALKAALGVLGAAGLFTGILGWCPGNKLAGRDSYHKPGPA